MKTICFVVPNFPTVTETFVTNQIIQTKAKGYRIKVLTKRLFSIDASSQKDILLEYQILKSTSKIDYNIPRDTLKRRVKLILLLIKYLPYWFRIKNVSLKKRFTTLPYKLHFYNSFKNVSVFHVQFAYSGIEIANMKSIGLLKGTIITTFHGHDAHYKNANELLVKQKYYKQLFNISNYITVNTPYLREKVIALGCHPKKLRVIPMSIDITNFKSNIVKVLPSDKPIKLLSIGRLVSLKGFEFAIRSVKYLIDKGYSVEYLIVGEGGQENYLLNLIEELDLSNYVSLVGSKSQIEIIDILEEHHIFLMSSITDELGRAEAQGVVTAEAQAMGLPVVAFRSGGVPYTVIENKTAFLVEEKQIEDYAKKIIELLTVEGLYSKMSLAARKFIVDEFSNEKVTKEFLNIFFS